MTSLAPYIPLAGCLCNVFFAFFVFLQDSRARAHRVYLLLGLAIAVWNLGSYFLFVVDVRAVALIWARVTLVGVLIAIAAFVHLSVIVAGFETGRWIRRLYAFQVLLIALDWTPWFVRDVQYLGSAGWYAISGPAFHLLNVPYAASFIALAILWRKRKSLPRLERRRLNSMIGAQVLIFSLGINDLLPIVGFINYPFTETPVYPYGSLGAVFYGIIIAFSVLHHQLLDAQVALSRLAAHAVRFAFLFFISAGLLLCASLITRGFTSQTLVASLIVFLAGSMLTSLLFPRLFGSAGLEKFERRILGDHFEYQDQVRVFIAEMPWYGDLDRLLNDLHQLFTSVFRLQTYQIILRDETTRAFTVFRAHPEAGPRALPEMNIESPVFQFFEDGKAEYLSLNDSAARLGTPSLESRARGQLGAFGSELCFPLTSEGEPFGLLLLGAKAGGEPFTATDIHLLVSLVKTMGLMVNQIRLKTQILHAQELDLLGRMSRGMAHDLNNLLTPLSTLLQLSQETGSLDDELLPVALRNVDTMRAYIKEALFFSENLRPDLQLCRLDVLVREAAEVAATSRPKAMRILPVLPENVLAELDGVLIQRLIANLITNAIDASQPGAQITVILERLGKTEADRDWLRVRVIDEGAGISRENMSRVLMPYFTTKNRGDSERGFGLGLAICRKIAALHGGNLSIESQPEIGTTVQLDLPSRRLAHPLPQPVPSHAV